MYTPDHEELLKKEEMLRKAIFEEDHRSQKAKQKRMLCGIIGFSAAIFFLAPDNGENIFLRIAGSLFLGGFCFFIALFIYSFVMSDADITMPEDKHLKYLKSEYNKLPDDMRRDTYFDIK